MNTRRVVITGMGAVSPGAKGLKAYLDLLQSARSGIQYVAEMEEYGFECRIGGIASFDPEAEDEYFNYHDLNLAAHCIQLACVAGVEAWKDAGMNIPGFRDDDVHWDTGAIIGTGISGIDVIGKNVVRNTDAKRVKRLGGLTVQNAMPSGSSAYLASILALGNQCTANSSACATGTESILEGYYRIKNGLADKMLAGGTDGYSLYCWAGFEGMRVLTRKYNDVPEQASRPMSESARGFVPGSGAGIVFLESLESAQKRGARIYAEVLGGMVNCGGQRNGGTMTFPNYEGVERILAESLNIAGISPVDIDLINGHLTGTKADLGEIKQWKKLIGNDKPFPFINATKSIIGHTLGAAGTLETIATIMQMNHNFVHANLNSEDMLPEIEEIVDLQRNGPTIKNNIDINIAVTAGFGFGDVNSVMVLKKWKE
jgi:3-oxoacyl-(acyl-carrier-protein) synthase